VESGASIGVLTSKGQTLMHIAAANDKLVPLVYFRGKIDPSAVTDMGETALMNACDQK